MEFRNMRAQAGISLIEVLVSMIIVAVGLLSLVSLQGRLQVLQMESYQRSQALIILHDMASRIALNRTAAASYVTTSPLGVGTACPTDVSTRQKSDFRDWCLALQGAAETVGGSNVGAMVGGRACVEPIIVGREYLLTVAWQGLAPATAPPASVGCAAGLYNGGAGTPCQNDQCRRTVTTVVRIADLT